jgi:hypothetical protein
LGGGQRGEKKFFFEKKNQKTFGPLRTGLGRPAVQARMKGPKVTSRYVEIDAVEMKARSLGGGKMPSIIT